MKKVKHTYIKKKYSIAFLMVLDGEKYGYFINIPTDRKYTKHLKRLVHIKHDIIKGFENEKAGEL